MKVRIDFRFMGRILRVFVLDSGHVNGIHLGHNPFEVLGLVERDMVSVKKDVISSFIR